MIVIPRGWTTTPEVDGVELVHPLGRDVAVIDYRERVRPLRKLGSLLRDLAIDPSSARVERLVTREGEHAALATIVTGDVQRDIGFVLCDDHYARIAAVCRARERFDELTRMIRELVTTDMQMLGVRRRRFEYDAPAGWQPIVRGFITDWLPPSYPRDASWLTAYPAMPVEHAPAELLASMLAPPEGAELAGEKLAPFGLANGLAGDVGEAEWVSTAGRGAKLACVLRDRRYAYVVEATGEGRDGLRTHRAAIERVLSSVQPIPLPTAVDASSTPSFWIE